MSKENFREVSSEQKFVMKNVGIDYFQWRTRRHILCFADIVYKLFYKSIIMSNMLRSHAIASGPVYTQP